MDLPLWFKAVLMGIVEGLTEFLPVSSTGHLMVLGKALHFDQEVFEIFIQLGALSAVWWLFRVKILRMCPWNWSRDEQGSKLAQMVILGTLPVLLIGAVAHSWIKHHLHGVSAIAWAFIVGGIVIFLVESFKPKVAIYKLEGLTARIALLVGIGQCFALYPGVSRSGATIVAGLLLGLSRAVATEFTFLVAVPTMTAATVYSVWGSRHEIDGSMAGLLAIGFLVSFLVAILIVKWFIRFVETHTFQSFAWYRIAMGLIFFALLSKGFFE